MAETPDERLLSSPESHFRGLVSASTGSDPVDCVLDRLAREAEEADIPIVGPMVGNLLSVLVRATGACRILELGTANGYSAIWMLRGCDAPEFRLITVEQSPDMIRRARSNFNAVSAGGRVELVEGGAPEVLDGLTPGFDLVFMDVDKWLYEALIEPCHRLLRSGGLLIADNTGFKDAAGFNQRMAADRRWQSVNIYAFLPFHSPEWDGICLAVKR